MTARRWHIPEAKAKLSEVLRRARAGEPQMIGSHDPCVVISAAQFDKLQPAPHLGRWLIENAPKGVEIDLPPRDDTRGDPFAESRS